MNLFFLIENYKIRLGKQIYFLKCARIQMINARGKTLFKNTPKRSVIEFYVKIMILARYHRIAVFLVTVSHSNTPSINVSQRLSPFKTTFKRFFTVTDGDIRLRTTKDGSVTIKSRWWTQAMVTGKNHNFTNISISKRFERILRCCLFKGIY